MHHFYSVIIGTELLNGRRVDKHFAFINQELQDRGLLHVGSFVIEDSPALIQNCFTMILQDPKSVMFCFGGLFELEVDARHFSMVGLGIVFVFVGHGQIGCCA